MGHGTCDFLTCDLTAEYIRINAEYSTRCRCRSALRQFCAGIGEAYAASMVIVRLNQMATEIVQTGRRPEKSQGFVHRGYHFHRLLHIDVEITRSKLQIHASTRLVSIGNFCQSLSYTIAIEDHLNMATKVRGNAERRRTQATQTR